MSVISLETTVPEGTIIGWTGAYPVLNQEGVALTASTSGTGNVTFPSQGRGFQVIVITLSAWDDAGQVYDFPAAFAVAPAILVDATEGASVTTTAVTLPASSSTTGYVILVGVAAPPS